MLATNMVLSLRIYHCPLAALANLGRFTGLVRIVSDCHGCQKLLNRGFDFRGCDRKLVIIDVKN
jgi:hypothetical protein